MNISAIPSRKLLAADSYSCSRKRASCSSRFTPSSASHTPGRSHQIQGLRLLFFREFIQHVSHFVIATTLYRLLDAKHFFNGGPQCFCSIDYEQVFAIRRQALIAQVAE